jgi:uncharacterized protein with NRDE domain
VHALSNHLLDEPWPKVVRARGRMEAALRKRDPAPASFELLSDAEGVPDAELPDTGMGIAWERRLAAALIVGQGYGTRASTVLTVTPAGDVRVEERTREADGSVSNVAAERFSITPAAAAA